MGFENIGREWTTQGLAQYLDEIGPPPWPARAITLHHTGFPDLAMRPQGLTVQHMEGARVEYEQRRGYSAGPHLFVDDTHCLGMSDLHKPGVHAHSYNGHSIGIEVLGNYNEESPFDGRGRSCWQTAIQVSACVLAWLGVPASPFSVHFHRNHEEAQKQGKECPGRRVEKTWVLDQLCAIGAGCGDPGLIIPPSPPDRR